MFRKILLGLVFSHFFIAASHAGESSPLYIGLSAAKFDSKYNQSAEPDGAMMMLGWDMNNFFAFEVAGGASNTYEDQTNNTTLKVDYVSSAFLRFNLRFNRVTIYALGGYSKAKTTSTSGATSTVTESDGGSVGYGIDFYGTRDLALSFRRVEFFDIDKPNEPKAHLGATMLGITYYYDTPKIHSRY